MENNDFNIFSDENAKNNLNGAAQWAKFLAIIGFIGCGLLALFALLLLTKSLGTGLVYLIVAAIGFLPVFYLYKFASSIANGLRLNNAEQAKSGLANLKAYFKISGILLIIYIAIVVITVIVALSTATQMMPY